jgi:succinoglycan biosynthesis transport protein ExoP
MSDLETYLDRVIEHRPAELPPPSARVVTPAHAEASRPTPDAEPSSPPPNVVAAILRRWYLVLAAFVIVAGMGIPAVWFLVEPGYVVTSFIRVAPAMTDILTGKEDSSLGGGNYEQFVNTQAISITSPSVLDKVVDDLAPRNLTFFKGDPNRHLDRIRTKLEFVFGPTRPMDRLKREISSGAISVNHLRDTELIAVTMKSMRPQEAQQIVDSFVQNYMAVYAYGATKEEAQTERRLEASMKEFQDKVDQGNQRMRQLALEGGAMALVGGDQRLAGLFSELAKLESSRISLETELQVTDPQTVTPETQTIDPNSVLLPPVLAARNQYINSDPEVQALTQRKVSLEQELVEAKQNLAVENPTIKQKEEFLEGFRARVEARRAEVGKQFDVIVSEQRKVAADQQRAAADQEEKNRLEKTREKRRETLASLERIKVHEERLNQIIKQQDENAQKAGRATVDIRVAQSQLDLDKEMFDTVARRLKELEMGRSRDPRITVHAKADVQGFEDKRLRYSASVAFGALGCGCLLAFLRDKADKRLRGPEDVASRLHMHVIGTIADAGVKGPALLAEQIAEDYQTIRTNLGLSANGGIPRRLAVASPGTQEGKTTFSINLASSLARSGKRVLLVDGDLRKPDIAVLMGIVVATQRSTQSEAEDGFAYTLCTTSLVGLDVLVPAGLAKTDPYEIIASPELAQRINVLTPNYDHVIIDTPPVLAFPDALIWARIAGSVVLASFMGRTTSSDLAEARLRLAQTRVQILGTVMNNVKDGQTYNRYRYGYGYGSAGSGPSRQHSQRARQRLLAPVEPADKQEGNSDKA